MSLGLDETAMCSPSRASNCRTAVLGREGGPYKVRHVCLGQGGMAGNDGRRRGPAGYGTNDVS